MGLKSIPYLKGKFENFDKPNEQDFIDFFDSYIHYTQTKDAYVKAGTGAFDDQNPTDNTNLPATPRANSVGVVLFDDYLCLYHYDSQTGWELKASMAFDGGTKRVIRFATETDLNNAPTPTDLEILYFVEETETLYFHDGNDFIDMKPDGALGAANSYFYGVWGSLGWHKIDMLSRFERYNQLNFFPGTGLYSNLYAVDGNGDPLSQYEKMLFMWTFNGGSPRYEAMSKQAFVCEDYDELKGALGHQLPDTVIVKNFTTNWEGQDYTVVGGVFYKDDPANYGGSPVGNGATRILTQDGVPFIRIWDGVNFIANWFEIGGEDRLGNYYVGDFADQGVRTSGDRIRQSVKLLLNDTYASTGYPVVHLHPNEVYDVDMDIDAGPVEINGHGATIRAYGLQAVLTADALVNDSTLTVDDASKFRIGMRINCYGSDGYMDQTHPIPGPPTQGSHAITGISGNVITIAPVVTNLVATGGKVQLYNEIMSLSARDNSKVTDVVFDGNRSVLDATLNGDANIGLLVLPQSQVAGKLLDGGVTLNNCRFRNFQGAAIKSSAVLNLNACTFENIGGSPVYIWGNAGQPFENSGAYLNECRFFDICNGDVAKWGITTHLAACTPVYVDEIVFNNCLAEEAHGGCIIGPIGQTTNGVTIRGGRYKNFTYIMYIKNNTGGTTDGISVTGAHFDNCGPLECQGDWVEEDLFRRATVSQNHFINSCVVLYGGFYAQVSNNTFEIDGDPNGTWYGKDFTTYAGLGSVIKISAREGDVSNNAMRGVNNSYFSQMYVGIYYNPVIASVNATGPQGLNISNNEITYFTQGITAQSGGANTNKQNVQVRNNQIRLVDSGGQSVTLLWGMSVGWGVYVEGNTVFITVANKHGMLVTGSQTSGELAATVRNNTITGTTYSGLLRIEAQNVLVSDNYLTGGIVYVNGLKTDNLVGPNYQMDLTANTITTIAGN